MKHKEVALLFPHYMPQERCFLLIKNVLKERLPGYFFKRLPCSATGEWDRVSDVIMSLPSTSYVSGAFILFFVPRKVRFAAHKHNPLSICRKVKSKDNFHAKARPA